MWIVTLLDVKDRARVSTHWVKMIEVELLAAEYTKTDRALTARKVIATLVSIEYLVTIDTQLVIHFDFFLFVNDPGIP